MNKRILLYLTESNIRDKEKFRKFVEIKLRRYKFQFMDILKKISGYILKRFTKVQLALILVLIVCAFIISESNVFTRFGYDMEIRNLKAQIKYYREKTVEDNAKLQELRSDKENIEKFARENYKMKRDNEEVFIIE